MPMLRIHLFGGLWIEEGERVLVRQSGRLSKPQELLVMLLIQKEGPVSNEQLMEDLWGNDEITNPTAALKNAIYSLRRLLQTDAAGPGPVITQNGRYVWDRGAAVWVDAWEFEKWADLGEKSAGKEAVQAYRQAISLYTGDLLPGLSDRPWVFNYLHFLRQKYQEVVLSLCRELFAAGEREGYEAVSYTHLDVYKRQLHRRPRLNLVLRRPWPRPPGC